MHITFWDGIYSLEKNISNLLNYLLQPLYNS